MFHIMMKKKEAFDLAFKLQIQEERTYFREEFGRRSGTTHNRGHAELTICLSGVVTRRTDQSLDQKRNSLMYNLMMLSNAIPNSQGILWVLCAPATDKQMGQDIGTSGFLERGVVLIRHMLRKVVTKS